MQVYVVTYIFHDMYTQEDKPINDIAFQSESAAKAYCDKQRKLEPEADYSYEQITLIEDDANENS